MGGNRQEYVRTIVLALSFTVAAEIFYLVVWGIFLFPAGSFLSKLVWTSTCGVGMGSVVAVFTILLVIDRLRGNAAIFASAGILFVAGSLCTLLCSQIDRSLNLFGGVEHSQLFIVAGLVPALIGAFLYGWILHSKTGHAALSRLGI